MKKILAILLTAVLALGLAACGGNGAPEESSKPELSTSLTQEELEEQVDFDNADPATAEDGEVRIPAGNDSGEESFPATPTDGVVNVTDPDVPLSSAPAGGLRSTLTPDEVWASDAGAAYSDFGNFTLPDTVLMEDGSLGSLSIPKIDLTVQVFETAEGDDEIENMTNGVAHFKNTSCWDGNVGLAGHSWGYADRNYFGNIDSLVAGDEITLTTALGERTYAVSKSVVIPETDWSYLERTDNNVLTLITCIKNVQTATRLCVQAVEVTAE